MAVMIPPLVHSGTRSPGERDLFHRLRDDPATSDWIVLHSLDIARHNSQRSGEADFVVIIPGKGVLCLEVKAHGHVRRQEGLWIYGTRGDEADARGPFKQASEAMHSLRGRLSNRDPALSRIVFWSSVVFTSVEFRVQSEEWHDWQVIDASSLRSRPISALLTQIIERARRYLAETPSAAWFDCTRIEPSETQCARLVQLMRPDFEVFESPRSRSRIRDAELKRYTAEQYGALDAMTANPRVIFEGPAGTGKTLLAIEAARRARAAGRRVLLLCFNRLLGTWLEREAETLLPEVRVCTLHRYMLSVAQQIPPGDVPGTFWEEDLPTQAIDQLLADDLPGQFDEVIIDEAQDILRDRYLDVIDLSLRGGLAAGRWRFFGDFERQAIYGTPRESFADLLERRAGSTPRYSLRINCRNTPRVAELVHALGGLVPPYSRVLRPDDGVEPEIRYYANAGEQGDLLGCALEELKSDGFCGDDVVILSPRAQDSCAAGVSVLPWSGGILRPSGPTSAGYTSYCSIHAFKGMESPAVIVTDVERVGRPEASALFYIATTRALHRLIILAHRRVRSEARSLVERQLMND